jgi:hypothetical protein
MFQITITDEAILAHLRNGNVSITVRDGNGKVCGIITPITEADKQPPISEEEIARRLANRTGPTYTTEEIISYLKSLPKKGA